MKLKILALLLAISNAVLQPQVGGDRAGLMRTIVAFPGAQSGGMSFDSRGVAVSNASGQPWQVTAVPVGQAMIAIGPGDARGRGWTGQSAQFGTFGGARQPTDTSAQSANGSSSAAASFFPGIVIAGAPRAQNDQSGGQTQNAQRGFGSFSSFAANQGGQTMQTMNSQTGQSGQAGFQQAPAGGQAQVVSMQIGQPFFAAGQPAASADQSRFGFQQTSSTTVTAPVAQVAFTPPQGGPAPQVTVQVTALTQPPAAPDANAAAQLAASGAAESQSSASFSQTTSTQTAQQSAASPFQQQFNMSAFGFPAQASQSASQTDNKALYQQYMNFLNSGATPPQQQSQPSQPQPQPQQQSQPQPQQPQQQAQTQQLPPSQPQFQPQPQFQQQPQPQQPSQFPQQAQPQFQPQQPPQFPQQPQPQQPPQFPQQSQFQPQQPQFPQQAQPQPLPLPTPIVEPPAQQPLPLPTPIAQPPAQQTLPMPTPNAQPSGQQPLPLPTPIVQNPNQQPQPVFPDQSLQQVNSAVSTLQNLVAAIPGARQVTTQTQTTQTQFQQGSLPQPQGQPQFPQQPFNPQPDFPPQPQPQPPVFPGQGSFGQTGFPFQQGAGQQPDAVPPGFPPLAPAGPVNTFQIPATSSTTQSNGVTTTTSSSGTIQTNLPLNETFIPGLDLASLIGNSTTTTTIITDPSKLPFPLPNLPAFNFPRPRSNTRLTYNLTLNTISAKQNLDTPAPVVIDQPTDPNLINKLDQLINLTKQRTNTTTQQIIYPYVIPIDSGDDETQILYNITRNDLNTTRGRVFPPPRIVTPPAPAPAPQPNTDALYALILQQLQNRRQQTVPVRVTPQPTATSVTALTVRPTEYLYDLKYGQGIKPITLGDGVSYTVNNIPASVLAPSNNAGPASRTSILGVPTVSYISGVNSNPSTSFLPSAFLSGGTRAINTGSTVLSPGTGSTLLSGGPSRFSSVISGARYVQ